MSGHTGAVPGKTQMLLGGGLDIDLLGADSQSLSQDSGPSAACRALPWEPGRSAWRRCSPRRSLLTQQPAYLCQKAQAGGSRISRVRVREELADVPQPGGAGKGVHDGMGQHVRVGVAQKTPLIGDLHAAQGSASGPPSADGRHIRVRSAVVSSHILLRCQQRLCQNQVGRRGDF